MFAVLPLFCLFTSKAYHAYTTGTLGTAQETIPYTYGDSNWKDKLTAYNGCTFSYDAIGNPTSDGIWSYEWEVGRRLKSMSAEGTALNFKYDHTHILSNSSRKSRNSSTSIRKLLSSLLSA